MGGSTVETGSSLPVEMTAKIPVETSRNSDTSKYRCTAGRGGALIRAVEAMSLKLIIAAGPAAGTRRRLMMLNE
jgi:hypothetical protein